MRDMFPVQAPILVTLMYRQFDLVHHLSDGRREENCLCSDWRSRLQLYIQLTYVNITLTPLAANARNSATSSPAFVQPDLRIEEWVFMFGDDVGRWVNRSKRYNLVTYEAGPFRFLGAGRYLAMPVKHKACRCFSPSRSVFLSFTILESHEFRPGKATVPS
jgi:hypothetical protein